MYLYAEKYNRVRFNENDPKLKGDELMEKLGYEGKYTLEGGGFEYKVPVAYWRKANQIHRYFIEIEKKNFKNSWAYARLKTYFEDDTKVIDPEKDKVLEDIVNQLSDTCTPIHVSREDLTNLLEICNSIARDFTTHEECYDYWKTEDPEFAKMKEELPTQSGFFFGNTEYDEYYFWDILDTKKMLTKILEDFPEGERILGEYDYDFIYRASW